MKQITVNMKTEKEIIEEETIIDNLKLHDAEMIVNYSSWFTLNKYDTDKMIDALESIGAENIYLEQDRGWCNQPEIVVFNGVSKSNAEDKLNEVFETQWISVGNKDWY